MRISKKVLTAAETLAFLAGAAVFWRLLQATGWDAIRRAWDAAGGRLAAIVALYPFMAAWDTLSWRGLFAEGATPRFLPLFWVRLAGEAVNNLTPGLDIGGEPLKIKWCMERLGTSRQDALSSTILAKTAILVAEGAFVWISLLAGWSYLPWPGHTRAFFTAGAVVVGAAVAALVLFQRSKIFFRWSPGTKDFYGRLLPRFAAATAFNLAGWLSGAVELWAFAWILGLPMDWRQALVMEGLVQLVRTASFFIPGNVGTQEAGYAFLSEAFGFGPAFGIALSLLKRARQLAWTAAGLAVWGVFQTGRARA